MKKFLLTSASVLAIGVVSASAADLPRREAMPVKSAVYVSPLYNWTGFYVGINGGGGWGRSEFSAPISSGSFGTSGGLVGGTLGYNYQMGQAVFGIEGDLDWSSIGGNTPCGVTSCEVRNNWLSTVRGRLGYAVDRFMPYVTGGVAFGDVKTSVAGIGDTRTTKTGWTLGGGIEAAIAGPWTAKAEYLYVDLGDTGTIVPGASANFHTNIVRAGLNYRF
jgi:outer membrane immunogenic protein